MGRETDTALENLQGSIGTVTTGGVMQQAAQGQSMHRQDMHRTAAKAVITAVVTSRHKGRMVCQTGVVCHLLNTVLHIVQLALHSILAVAQAVLLP